MEVLGEANTIALIGLLGGIALGLAARLGRFCTLGAIEDYLYGADPRRMGMWGVSVGVAIIGTQVLLGAAFVEGSDVAYLSRAWNPLSTVIGGLLFGYGMALTGNCGYGALARLGGGDLRAFVIVLVMGLSAYFVMSGPLAHLRVMLFPVVQSSDTSQGLAQLLNGFGVAPWVVGIVAGAIIVLASLRTARGKPFRSYGLWGVLVGLAITSGWVGTHWVATVGFDGETIRTHTFAAPVGDTIFYSMTASGNTVSFSVGSVMGVIIGAAFGSMFKKQFRWEACEDPRELKRQIFGAALMGVGAILAVGCSVGQGIAAFSVLAYSAPVTLIAIFCGAAFGLRQLITGFKVAA